MGLLCSNVSPTRCQGRQEQLEPLSGTGWVPPLSAPSDSVPDSMIESVIESVILWFSDSVIDSLIDFVIDAVIL